ncbi:MAG: TonB-dependent receptor [Prevotella sp.]|nr:TonB-dependent receptor [Prevotella sp.]
MCYKVKRIVFTFLLMLGCTSATAQTTLREQVDELRRQHDVSFVYDGALDLTARYDGPQLAGMPLGRALRTLFQGTSIDWRQEGRYVTLKQRAQRHTLSGHVNDAAGERLINATVYDLTTRQGTMTNEYGYYSLTLPEGDHRLRITYVGYHEQTVSVSLTADRRLDIALEEGRQVGEVVVEGNLSSPVVGTQMGLRSLSQADVKTEFALLSSPDVIKSLQRLSGVQEGIELASGLYVHGGNDDENLFLIDGTPLYQVNHSLGLFSSFNADVVKNVDFYKSGFPARYGGRLSSVVDVRTRDGHMHEWHGAYRLGLLDGSVQFDGPIRRGRTSLNVGLRRSWLDLLTEPAFAIANRLSDEEQIKLNYNFHDLNAKLTHVLNDSSRLSLSIYSGADRLTTKDDWDDGHDDYTDRDIMENRLRWGNLNAALDWNGQLSPRLMANLTAVYTHNRANISYSDDWRYGRGDEMTINHNEHTSRSTIDDVGYRALFDYRPQPRHHIRFGHDYTYHHFRPQTHSELYYFGTAEGDTLSAASANRQTGHELTLYGEDQLTLNDRWSLNGGLNMSLFVVSGKTYCSLDPRLAVKLQLRPWMSLKASYTMMTQYVHRISNSFLDLPTAYWVPTTRRTRPMHSSQLAAGIYMQPSRRWTLSLEGYYKLTRHLLLSNSWAGLEPPAASWDTEVMDGRGRFYGIELDARYVTPRLQMEAAYTLSWNKRRFDDFYPRWFYDKFDNRHKLNITARLHLSKKKEMYAAWTMHTGNRMTMPTQFVQLPDMPGRDGAADQLWDLGRRDYIYERPNNVVLPTYHRLDLGFNLHHTTKHGHERIWNWSIYNAYCHLNTLWTSVQETNDGRFRVKTHGYIPIVPSFSYTIKW